MATSAFGPGCPYDRAHGDDHLARFTCHLVDHQLRCGCHLPIEANWKSSMHHMRGGDAQFRDPQTPQVVRDDVPAGPPPDHQGGRRLFVRSSSALVPPPPTSTGNDSYPAAAGLFDRLFEPGLRAAFPHTVRTQETKTNSDRHLRPRTTMRSWRVAAAGHHRRQLSWDVNA